MKKQKTPFSPFSFIRFSILLLLMFFVSSVVTSQDASLSQAISKAIKAADATALANHFDASIELSLPDTEGTYSKKQAEQILKQFFGANPIKQFTSDHSGSSGYGASYLIGSYVNTDDQKFRVYILIKTKESNGLIHLVQFEEE